MRSPYVLYWGAEVAGADAVNDSRFGSVYDAKAARCPRKLFSAHQSHLADKRQKLTEVNTTPSMRSEMLPMPGWSIKYNLCTKYDEGTFMKISARDVVPLSQARANLSELAEEVKAGAEKVITQNGESYVALIDAQRLDYYHQLEREHIHLLLLDEAGKGLDDVAAGRVKDARSAIKALKRRRGV